MSNIPKLRFKEFSGEWEDKELNKLTKIYDGTHSTPKYVEEGIPFYSVEHLTANQFKKTRYITEDIFEKENKRVKLEKNDILMTRIGDIGTSRLLDWDVKASFYVSLALIKQNKNFNSSFLNLAIKSINFQQQLYSKTLHVAFPKKINLGEIGQSKIYLPSKPEQEKIASFLTSVDTKIEQLTKKETLLQEYKKGVMAQIFSQEIRFKDDNGSEFSEWEEKKLGKLCEIKTGKLDANAMIEKGKYRFYTCAKDYYLIDDYAFDTDALIISGNGANVGYIHHYNGKFNAYQRTYVLDKFKDNIFYLKYFLEKYLYQRIFTEKKEGNTPYIVMSTLSEMDIFIPCFLEQTKIANFLSLIDKKIELVQRELEKTKEFKKALLQQMFV